jgi:hypothetical protein
MTKHTLSARSLLPWYEDVENSRFLTPPETVCQKPRLVISRGVLTNLQTLAIWYVTCGKSSFRPVEAGMHAHAALHLTDRDRPIATRGFWGTPPYRGTFGSARIFVSTLCHRVRFCRNSLNSTLGLFVYCHSIDFYHTVETSAKRATLTFKTCRQSQA